MARFKDVNWNLAQAPGGAPATWEQVQLALLMDIRDELQRLNGLLHCPNFTGIPHTLTTIKRNTTPKRKKPVARKGR